jgi:hypothetical protein
MSTQHHDSHSPADFDQDRALDDVRYRVLLAIPTETYIPIFAIGVETRRSQCETIVLDDREEISRLVGGNLSRNLLARYGEHRVMQVRIRVSPRTVLYSQWLAFPTLAQAGDFVRENSRFGLTAIQVRSHAEYTARKAALENGLTRGRFDLSRVEPRLRLNRAREYVEGNRRAHPLRSQKQRHCNRGRTAHRSGGWRRCWFGQTRLGAVWGSRARGAGFDSRRRGSR